ncbi:ComEA family DNA-binding protein [Luteimonas salinilitoris]|uniref:ComEA family DNA-binding protein n=1 Tax=Luteimonas salinilitoris TaxID=3237697 RepID=A0ABV4HKJ1_9GAMM
MNALKTGFASLLLSLLMLGGALASDRVNINTADAATLESALVNIGPSKAEAIVAHRKEHGVFKSVEELATVKGVGLKTVERNRDRIELGSAPQRRTTAAPAASSPAKGGAQQR